MWRSKSTAEMPIPGPPITLIHYPLSPSASKVTTYLAFRGIPYQEAHASRPVLEALGVNYRRSPVMAIGRDIYCDALLILEKLEELYPGSHLAGETGSERALERLLERWTGGEVLRDVLGMVGEGDSVGKNQDFSSDRAAYSGKSLSSERQDKQTSAALSNLRAHFEFLENDVLGDGDRWVHEEENPGLGDIHAAWIFHWLLELPGLVSMDVFSADKYPLTMAWHERYKTAVSNARERAPKPKKLEGAEAVKEILEASFCEDDIVVDEEDPLGLKRGQLVDVFPKDVDSYKESGELTGLTVQEVVIGKKSKEGGKDVRIHCPRWNFTTEIAGTCGKNDAERNGQEDLHHY